MSFSPSEPQLSVIIPAFNETENVGGVVEESIEHLEKTGLTYEIILVNDGSTDQTGAVLDRLAAAHPGKVTALHHANNRGMGAALGTGLDAGRGRILTWIPSDGQFLLADVLTALPLTQSNDLVIAMRTGVRQSWRIVITSLFHFMVQRMFRFNPGDICGIFLVTPAIYRRCRPQSENVFFTVELPIRAGHAGLRMGKFELPLKDRRAGHSKVSNWRTYLRNLREIFLVWWRTR